MKRLISLSLLIGFAFSSPQTGHAVIEQINATSTIKELSASKTKKDRWYQQKFHNKVYKKYSLNGIFKPRFIHKKLGNPTVRKTNSKAVIGFICGLLSLLSNILAFILVVAFNQSWIIILPLILGFLGIILSANGLQEIKGNPDVYEGQSTAVTGIVLSSISIVLALLMFIIF